MKRISLLLLVISAPGFCSQTEALTLTNIEQKTFKSANPTSQDDIPPTEDLMREHGILNRLLLIFEEVIKTCTGTSVLHEHELSAALEIMQSFIENYHEKLEEDYIFPLFEKNRKELSLIKTLREQHTAGRKITARLSNILKSNRYRGAHQKRIIKNLLHKLIRMYRPHEARENTVLFPQVRSLLTASEFDALGERFEELEHKLFGKAGFEGIVNKVADIEKRLGIYTLEQFTPQEI